VCAGKIAGGQFRVFGIHAVSLPCFTGFEP
jgi:hypothetical protein